MRIFFKGRNTEKDNKVDSAGWIFFFFFPTEMASSQMEKFLASYNMFSVNHE